jgi:hypothetical protein
MNHKKNQNNELMPQNNELMSPDNMKYVGFSFIGIFLSNILNVCGVLSGEEGINYYAEAHLSSWNSWMHTIGMPFTLYGISCWVPALFNSIRLISKNGRTKMQLAVWYMYMIHYMTIDFKRALFCAAFYLYPCYRAYTKTASTQSNFKLFLHGFLISFSSLVFQEIIGHYMGGDIPSRPEGVLNAILYSVIYSTYHIV